MQLPCQEKEIWYNGISLASNTFGASPISPAIKLTVITPKMIDSKSEAFIVTVIYIMI